MKYIILVGSLLINLVVAHSIANDFIEQDYTDFSWIDNYIPSKIEYTSDNQVAIVSQTQLIFDAFWTELVQLANITAPEAEDIKFPRVQVREALTKYVITQLIIDPVRPAQVHLYNAEYEHKKEVWAHKAIKDFLMSKDNQLTFTKRDIQSWFLLTDINTESLKQP